MKLKINDIRPQASKFKLKYTGKEYRLRPMSFDDELWLHRQFGDQVEEIFKELKIEPICRIVYRLMENEDRSDFTERTVTIIDENGKKASDTLGGARLLMAMIIGGLEEKISIVQACLDTVGASRAVVDKLTNTKEKKSPQKRTGKRS